MSDRAELRPKNETRMKSLFPSIALALACLCSLNAADPQKPHIVLIMCDDMGFSDLSSYGGEIQTPHIDSLADQGVRFTNFKNTGRCCPSRASLMTGRYQHAVGMGWMTAVDEHRDGYRGQLASGVPTIAEILKPLGYRSYMSGKWHLSLDPSFQKQKSPNGSWPFQRGFDRSYGMLGGGGSYRTTKSVFEDSKHKPNIPKDYYLTDAITENAVRFIEEHRAEDPMFLYLAHYAPHRPLMAPEDRIRRCEERYRVGYDKLREKRYKKMKQLGILSSEQNLPVHEAEYGNGRPSWKSLDSKTQQKWIREMATYAAMIEIMDDGIGMVVDALKARGMYENTVLIFLSDNGATSEGGLVSKLAADLSNTPFRDYKKGTYEGGISSPLIIHSPKRFNQYQGQIRSGIGHINDICPSILDLVGIEYPITFNGSAIPSVDGSSLIPQLRGETQAGRDTFFEHQTACSIISKEWKLVRPNKVVAWQLFDLKNDPFEQKDLAKKFPERVTELERRWDSWARDNSVLPLSEQPGWGSRIGYFKKLHPDQSGQN